MELGELKNVEGYNKEILKLIQKLNISEDNVEIYKTGYHDMKRERDELSEKLDKECNDNYKLEGQLNDMTKQRDSLIKDVEKLRELKDQLIFENRYLEEQVKSLRNKYTNLTEHIKDKALNNPSEHRYFRLVHFIDEIEGAD